jgi:hypothetical protein
MQLRWRADWSGTCLRARRDWSRAGQGVAIEYVLVVFWRLVYAAQVCDQTAAAVEEALRFSTAKPLSSATSAAADCERHRRAADDIHFIQGAINNQIAPGALIEQH